MRRFLILLLALSWGTLAFGTLYSLGYDRGAGYPSMAETLLRWALPAALPLLIGVFVANSQVGWHKYLRWLCVALLVAQAAFLFICTWIKILVFPPLLGAWLLLWPEIKGNVPPVPRRQRLQNIVLWMVGLGVFVWWHWFHFPLPGDAEMIKHFNAHRGEFEQLVQGYRNFRRYLPTADEGRQEKQINEQENKLRQRKKLTPDARLAIAEARTQLIKKFGPRPSYTLLPEVKALMENTGVYNVHPASGASGIWFPDHYSAKSIQVIKLYERGMSTAERIDILKREMPNLLEGVPPVRDLTDVGNLIEVIEIEMGTLKQPDWVHRWRYNSFLLKGYYHFPQVPRVENGHLLLYDFRTPNGIGSGPRVLDSLDSYPPDWQPGECVLKRIDGHWFIALCRTY